VFGSFDRVSKGFAELKKINRQASEITAQGPPAIRAAALQ
jgi:hypothetical protein